jgi:hypothetical protein
MCSPRNVSLQNTFSTKCVLYRMCSPVSACRADCLTPRLLVHVPRTCPRGEPGLRSVHGEHSGTSLRQHARTSIITVLYTTHHSCTLLTTPFTHSTLLTWPRSLERGFSLLNLHASSLPLVPRAPDLKGLATIHF